MQLRSCGIYNANASFYIKTPPPPHCYALTLSILVLQIQSIELGGRHPLQEMIVENFIPNDTALGGNRQPINIITGPNFSGKSVYLKQVGLLVVLAHIGAFLPCECAVIGLTDRIFTRINSVESCSLPQGR